MKTENEMTGFFIGCHLSSSGGFSAMAKTAHEINANTFQFFTRNPRGGKEKEISDIEKQNQLTEYILDVTKQIVINLRVGVIENKINTEINYR